MIELDKPVKVNDLGKWLGAEKDIGKNRHDPVQGKNPDLIPCVTMSDEIEGIVEEPDPVGVHPSPALLFPAHGEIDDLDGPLAEIEGHQLGEAERHRDVVLDRVKHRPEAFTLYLIGV